MTAYIPAPDGSPADAPRVFVALADVMRDVVPVGKDQVNTSQRYKFRGIDDLMSAVAGPLRAHGVFILPEVVEKTAERHGEKMTTVRITMRFRIYGPAGDCLVATVPGEAADFADKATNKAMSAALKYLLLQVLMIPVDGRSIDDGDRDHPVPVSAPEPASDPDPGQVGQLAAGAVQAATDATDPELVRAIYRQAQDMGLLATVVSTPLGELELGAFLVACGGRLAGLGVAA
jgi:hypothetical protein